MELVAETRNKFGKAVQSLRREGLIHAELYGHGTENLHLSVRAKDFDKVFRQAGENTLVDVVIAGTKRPAVIHDIACDPVTDEVLAVDFYQVRLDERMKVKVPIAFVGEAPAVKDKGGVLVKAMQEIEIECFPVNIPHAINADLTAIADIGGSLYVKDLRVGADVKILVSPETVIATVKEKAAKEEIAPAPAPDVESVKVETEEKKADRQAKKEAASPEASKAEAPKT